MAFCKCAASSRYYRFVCCQCNNLTMTLLLLRACVCMWMGVCVRVLLMSGAAVNDSIRLFLNALVTPMGHSARESAHSAERAQTLAGHQRDTHTHTHFNTHTHRWTHAHMLHTDNQWCALTYPFVCLFTTSLACVSCWQSNNMRGAESLGERSLIHQGKCMLLCARVCIEIWNIPLQCCWLPEWNIHATAAADQI